MVATPLAPGGVSDAAPRLAAANGRALCRLPESVDIDLACTTGTLPEARHSGFATSFCFPARVHLRYTSNCAPGGTLAGTTASFHEAKVWRCVAIKLVGAT